MHKNPPVAHTPGTQPSPLQCSLQVSLGSISCLDASPGRHVWITLCLSHACVVLLSTHILPFILSTPYWWKEQVPLGVLCLLSLAGLWFQLQLLKKGLNSSTCLAYSVFCSGTFSDTQETSGTLHKNRKYGGAKSSGGSQLTANYLVLPADGYGRHAGHSSFRS